MVSGAISTVSRKSGVSNNSPSERVVSTMLRVNAKRTAKGWSAPGRPSFPLSVRFQYAREPGLRDASAVRVHDTDTRGGGIAAANRVARFTLDLP